MSSQLKDNLYEEDLELLKSLHNFNKKIELKDKDDNILIKYLKNKQIIKDNTSDSLSLFTKELSRQIIKGNNIILPFIDPCHDLIEAYINCDNEKEKEIFKDNSIFIQLIENSFINRKVLFPIYSYFTEIYSDVDNLNESDEILNKLPKITNLFKLFYTLSESETKKINSFSSFCFMGSGLSLSGLSSLPQNTILRLKIDFLNSKYLYYINKQDDLVNSNGCFINYSKLFENKNIGEITSVTFMIANKTIRIYVNNSLTGFGKPLNDDAINILNNFYGQIKSINLSLNKECPNNIEKALHSKSMLPFPLKNDGVIFKNKFQIDKEKFMEKLNFQRVYTDLENVDFDIYNQNKNNDDIIIELVLKAQDVNLIKVNYINYKEEKFNVFDYFGGIIQFLPFLKIINGFYKNKNIKIINKIEKIAFLIDFTETILLIIFNHINKSGFEKQDNFGIYWSFFFYLLNKIELFKDQEINIDINNFSSYKLDIKNKIYFELFRKFLEFINSKDKDEKELIKKFSEILSDAKKDVNNISLFPEKTNEQLYRHLMKQLFIYNRLWSRQYLFFSKVPDYYHKKDKKIKIKYKRINNYTCNYQQPLIYPILEINKYYPDFKRFKLDNLYKKNNNEEEILNYDFSLDIYNNISTLSDYIDNKFLDNYQIANINKKCCLIKKMYHIKGEIGAIFDSNSKSNGKIFFISNFPEKRIGNNEDSKSKLCYGSVFPCLEKEKKRLLVFPMDKILFVLLRIYYYRKSGLEIFTTYNKSYYFNFWNENERNSIIQIFENHFKCIKDSKNTNIGWFNNDYVDVLKPLFNEEISLWNTKNFFYTNFDKLMIINLFSNRSFNDLYQYPVFPMLYNEIGYKRNMGQHIGFQELTEESIERKKLIQETYIYAQNYESDEEGESNPEKYYFNIMYSNITFTCNYLIRVFPYSFIAIEYQGDGFDDPNRLFYSIKKTLFNTLTQRGDLRELIPEMFYFPPLFYNKNNVELKKLSNNKKIDLVNIEEDFDGGNLRKYIFLKDMRQYLEEEKINSWIDLIFGIKKDYYQGSERYYKIQNDITFDFSLNNYNYDLLMQEYDFGVLPLQLLKQKFPENPKISDELKKEIFELNKKKYTKERFNCLIEGKESYICKGEKGINNKYLKIVNKIQNVSKNIFSKLYSRFKDNYSKENNNIKYLFVGDIFGNLSVYQKFRKNNENSKNIIMEIGPEKKLLDKIENPKKREYKLIGTLNDHTGEIKYIDYNPRLNLLIDCGSDGYINLYTMPNLKLILSIQAKDYNIKEPLNNVVLISNPFPMICCINSKYIIVFDINGEFINKIILEEKNIFFNIDKNCGLFNDSITYFKDGKEKEYSLVPDKKDIFIVKKFI